MLTNAAAHIASLPGLRLQAIKFCSESPVISLHRIPLLETCPSWKLLISQHYWFVLFLALHRVLCKTRKLFLINDVAVCLLLLVQYPFLSLVKTFPNHWHLDQFFQWLCSLNLRLMNWYAADLSTLLRNCADLQCVTNGELCLRILFPVFPILLEAMRNNRCGIASAWMIFILW